MGSNPERVRAATIFARTENRVGFLVGLNTAIDATKSVE
jgi:hypothetical protein